jgi:WS/DGAT/MGAT family acyltransferase
MEKLSLFDQMFYKLDEAGVGALVMQGALVLDPGTAPGPLDAETLAAHIGARVQDIPLLRKKLVRDPLGIGDLRPVGDAGFDLADHITRATLPAPGDEAAFVAHLQRFSTERLDMKKPLWRFEVVDGLANGKLAMLSKLHHALFDGIGAIQTLGSLYDDEPRPPDERRRLRRGRVREPSGLELTARAVADSVSRWTAGPRFLRRNAGAIVGSLGAALRDRLRGETEEIVVSRTSLNVKLSDQRVVAYRVFDLPEFKALARALDCKVNDLAMLLCSAAFEHYFDGIGEELESDVVASMPINTREEKHGSTGNVLSVSKVNLRTTVPGLIDRLRMIQRDAQAAKDRARSEDGNAVDVDELMALVSPLLADAMAAIAGRALDWDVSWDDYLIANAVVTNVPGPRGQIYVAGARIEYSIPMIPMADTMALAWGITSFGDSLTIGLHGCGEAIRDPQLMIEGVDKAWAELTAFAARA